MEIYYTTTSNGDIQEWLRSISPPIVRDCERGIDFFAELVASAVKEKLDEKESVTLAAEVDVFSGFKFNGPCLRRLFIDGKVFYKLF
eukprot:gene3222-1540_t